MFSISETEVSNPLTGSTFSKDVFYLKAFILPVTFVSFNATLNNREILLQWKTAQEINTSNFKVQRSLTGNQFTDITQVKASGITAGSLYTFSDESYIKTGVPQTVYYRIQETDKDGKQFNSVIDVIHNNATAFSIYPNPAKNFINLNVADVAVADAVSIYDTKGHLIQQWHNYQVNQPINISNFSKGTYLVRIKIKDNTSTTTIIKD